MYPKGVRNWHDVANCVAALSYCCLCETPCLSKLGSDVVALCEHRRKLRAEQQKTPAYRLRDYLRKRLAAHYDGSIDCMQGSFIVAVAIEASCVSGHSPLH